MSQKAKIVVGALLEAEELDWEPDPEDPDDHMPKVPRIETIEVYGRRWFRRSYGNTYCIADIVINSRVVHKTAVQSGYGDHYLYIAFDWLEDHGYFSRERYSNGGQEAPWHVAGRLGFKLYYAAVDVMRERDLY